MKKIPLHVENWLKLSIAEFRMESKDHLKQINEHKFGSRNDLSVRSTLFTIHLPLSTALGTFPPATTYKYSSNLFFAISIKHRAYRIEHSVKASEQSSDLQEVQSLAWVTPY